MWPRILRLLRTGLNAYSFYQNPVRFILSILGIILIPYLAYLFWGAIIIIALIVLASYLIYRAVSASRQDGYNY